MSLENPNKESEKGGLSRRRFLKCGLAAAAASVVGALMYSDDPNDLGPLDFSLSEPIGKFGLGTADFQVQPLILGADGKPLVRSDWEHELVSAQNGIKFRIIGTVDSASLPNFHKTYPHVIDQLPGLNAGSFRMSLDFGRLCPKEGAFDENLMGDYVKILASCHFKGIDPVITVHHWPWPKAFAEYDGDQIKKGALEHPDIVKHFAFYADKVADFLCDPDKIRNALKDEGYDKDFLDQVCDERLICRWFVSLNEPACMVVNPYVIGEFPPFEKGSIMKVGKLWPKLQQMHSYTYDALHERAVKRNIAGKDGDVKVGMSYNLMLPLYWPYSHGLMEEMESGKNTDFIGLQYYFRMLIGFNGFKGADKLHRSKHPGHGQIYPRGIYKVLEFASKLFPDKPLWVSELGFPEDKDQSDLSRPDFLLRSVYHLLRAKRHGIKVSGLFLWALINNLEWTHGMDVPFGILDKDGNRLPSDRDQHDHISSRQVVTSIGKHLRSPTLESAQDLTALQTLTAKQLLKAAG